MNKPKVSIVIPVYNGANYVCEAIESALSQTYKNVEVIVVNDGSTDDGATDNAIAPYLDRIKYITKENGGVSSALNTAIRSMSGEYFSWLSHDDLYSPTKVEKQISLVENSNDIILCSGDMFDETGKTLKHFVRTLEGRFSGRELYAQNITGYHLNGLGFLIPKHVFDKVGLFDESMRYIQDYDQWLRIMIRDDYTFVCHRDKLVHTRIHSGQQTNTISGLFDVDREKMAAKLINLIRDDNEITQKTDLYLLFYKGFVQGDNANGKEITKSLLLQSGVSTLKIWLIDIRYGLLGQAKRIVRNTINAIRKSKGERN